MKHLIAFLVTAGAFGAGLYATFRGPDGALGGARRRRRSGLRGPHEEHELQLYCENDGELHRQQGSMIEKNLERRLKKGTYDHSKAPKLWGYLVENCAKKYSKEFSDGRDWHKMFSVADRKAVAQKFADHFLQEWNIQNKYGHVPGGRSR